MTIDSVEVSQAQTNLISLRILNRVRLIAIHIQLGLIVVAIFYLDIQLPLLWLIGIIAAEVIFQLFNHFSIAKKTAVNSSEIFTHIIFDSLVLAALVYFSGGASNPFIYLLLVPVALGTMMLKPVFLLLVSVLELILYSLLHVYKLPLEVAESSPLLSFHLHLVGMWINFGFTVILIATFGMLARNAMTRQQEKIRSFREKQLKDEQILSLGIMSASAAHELGTPLSTMAVIVDDLKHDNKATEILQDMELLAQQISICRDTIQDLSEKSQLTRKKINNLANKSYSLNLQLQTLVDIWLVYRPKVDVSCEWSKDLTLNTTQLSISVEQAITNLLDNAADASQEANETAVNIAGFIGNNNLIIEIIDFGSGISEELKQSLGHFIQTTEKQGNLGWGLFLSNASLERAGGSVQLQAEENGGTLTRITLPLGEHQWK